VNFYDSRGDSLNEIRDRYERLRAEVQARRRKEPARGRTATFWRRLGAAPHTTLGPARTRILVEAVATIP
jgi:muconolactone delta-isomerase